MDPVMGLGPRNEATPPTTIKPPPADNPAQRARLEVFRYPDNVDRLANQMARSAASPIRKRRPTRIRRDLATGDVDARSGWGAHPWAGF